MNKKMIADWNMRVTKRDTVYMLGDFTMIRMKGLYEVLEIIDQLNGTIHVIFGNHDHKEMWHVIAIMRPGKVIIEGERLETKINGHEITMCHFSHQAWNKSHFGAWHMFGHSHNTLPGIGKSMDVGVDAHYALHHNWAPFSFEEVKEFLDNKEIVGRV